MSWSFLILIPLTLLVGCESSSPTDHAIHWQEIAARDNGHSLDRPQIYRVCAPVDWIRYDPLPDESIVDSTKSNCEFLIHEGPNSIRITVHTFPIIESDKRIPPQAQIARWKKQIVDLDIMTTTIFDESHGGYSGLFFEGEGTVHDIATRVMGWSMLLASGYERQLGLGRHPDDHFKRADYTIKASGTPEMMDRHRNAIIAFAQSFELIDELPTPL